MGRSGTSWRETRSRLREDRRRLREVRGRGVRLDPSWICVWLYRWSHWIHCRGWERTARAIWHVNLIVTGADLVPSSSFGGGLLIPHPVGVSLIGVAGRNFTVLAQAGLGGELGRDTDVGAGRGVPLVGDDVTLAEASGVLGPVRIGHRVRFAPGCIAARDVPDDGHVGAS